jgi:magnesium-transporting ATPase (P-type)
LVDATRHLGIAYVGGDEQIAKLIIYREEQNTLKDYYENLNVDILQIMEFKSARGMMSVIVKLHDKLILFAKGGDKKIDALLTENQPFKESVKSRATKLSEKGFRVLWIAMKLVDEDFFYNWKNSYEEGLKHLTNEDEIDNHKVATYKLIENGLTLIGCTAVEDKLQDQVPQVIKELQQAGINIWVLTGDNLPTAKNIGLIMLI